MNRSEITELHPEDVRNFMEEIVAHLELSNDTQKDTGTALFEIRQMKFFSSYEDEVKRIVGPINHYSHKNGKYIWSDEHFIGIINNQWILDITCEPGGRIYYNENDYWERSGIRAINNG